MGQQVDLHDLSGHRGYWLPLQPHDVNQPTLLIQALQTPSDPFARTITSHFSVEFQPRLAQVGDAPPAGQREPLSSETTRQFLRDFYRPYNQKLYDFLGRDFGWD